MKKIFGLVFIPLLGMLVGCNHPSTSSKEEFYTITDMVNREVKIANDADSFVCLGPGALRQYCYVADVNQLAGIESYEKTSNKATRPYVNAIKNIDELPTIGGGGGKDTTNLEELLQVKPDVVFTAYTTDPSKLDLMSQKTGIPVVGVGYNPNGLFAEDIYQSLKLIGKITHHEKRAEEVVNFFESAKKELMDKASVNPTKLTAYVGAINRKGQHGLNYTTSDYLIFDVLNIKNAVQDLGVKGYVELDKESLPKIDPDVIFIDAGGLPIVQQEIAKQSEFYNSLKAFKNKKVYIQMPFTFYSNNLDVALANAYFTAMCIYPEQFKGMNIKEKFQEITDFLLNVDVYDAMCEKFGCEYGSYFSL